MHWKMLFGKEFCNFMSKFAYLGGIRVCSCRKCVWVWLISFERSFSVSDMLVKAVVVEAKWLLKYSVQWKKPSGIHYINYKISKSTFKNCWVFKIRPSTPGKNDSNSQFKVPKSVKWKDIYSGAHLWTSCTFMYGLGYERGEHKYPHIKNQSYWILMKKCGVYIELQLESVAFWKVCVFVPLCIEMSWSS